MSLQTQLLRGVVVLPVLLLLAVASVTAPAARAQAEARPHAHVATMVVVSDGGAVAIVRHAPH
jgi:hypothetical protein